MNMGTQYLTQSQLEPVSYTHLSPSAGRYLGQLSNKIRRRMDTFNFNGEFSGAQGKILHFMLAQSEDVFQRDIEEAFSLRPPTASEILKKMEQNGLISRQPVSYDARLKKIVLLPKALPVSYTHLDVYKRQGRYSSVLLRLHFY